MESHGWYQLEPFHWNAADGVLRRKEKLGARIVSLEIRGGDGILEIHGAALTPRLEARLRRMFQLDIDTSEFITLTRKSPAHVWVEASGFGRLLCGSTLWEDIVKIITTTNTLWSQTRRMVELLVAKCGSKGAFPDPEQVASFSPDELQRDCRLGYRAKSIHLLASGIVGGTFDLAKIADPAQTTQELFRSYQVLPGIGPYGSAHLLAMDGRHDFIAVDTEFRRFVRDTYHRGRKVADDVMLERYRKWGKWQYLAYWAELWGDYRGAKASEAAQ